MSSYQRTRDSRREFLKGVAAAAGGVALMPVVTSSCATSGTKQSATSQANPAASVPPTVPNAEPEQWDAIAYNRQRGNAGAIPPSYLESVNGPEGANKHLGKHLPYVPQLDGVALPSGVVAIMWGDPQKGYAKHPNAPKNESNNNEGHWYNWIKIRKAVVEEAEEVTNEYPDWPGTDEQRQEHYVVFGGGDITADSGKNTVYLAKLPSDVARGDRIRIWAHCLTHGEYVDFITVQ